MTLALIAPLILTVLGLTLFEVINSVDNAVINAEVLGKMSPWAKKWFLVWGIFLAVFVVRGVLPWLILWGSVPGIGPWEAFVASFSSDPRVLGAVEMSKPILLCGSGLFLVYLFLHWLFLETKEFGLVGEKFIARHGVWFYTVASLVLGVVVWKTIHINPMMAVGAVMGSTAFFLVHGFKENAERAEERMLEGDNSMSDWSKILYLEAIDACFSVDGVLGAFAFTTAVPLILIGNGIGVWVVRKLTVSNVDTIKKFVFLKNGAMYSIFSLGIIMLAEAFGAHIPSWVSPVITFCVIGFFLFKSVAVLNSQKA
ncbi:MAG: DUF475 domain-containing protein [bacterium]